MKLTVPFLQYSAYQMRRWSLMMTTQAGSGHATSSLSAADIVAVLFFHTMRFDPKNFNNPDNDRFILSKGHAVPIVYAAWHQLGMISDDEFLTYRQFDSVLEGHPTLRFAYTEAATGSLGTGLSIGLGQALCATLDKRDYHTFVLMGDSEIAEGSIWEAAQLAAYYNAHNLIGIVDVNRLGQSTPTMQALEGDEAARFAAMFGAFGWQTYTVDGHDVQALIEVFDKAKRSHDKPVMILAKTKKGYGVDLFEDKEDFHGKPLTKEQLPSALKNLEERFKAVSTYKKDGQWQPNLPEKTMVIQKVAPGMMPDPAYDKQMKVSTRKAYGQALAALGFVAPDVISLDAEVKNSTYADIFEKAHPERFYQCFIAEQNMVGMAIGFNRRGKVPFVSTFGVFFARAFDQIRMAAIGNAALRLSGSHAGVSIGQDGPSQMALEDIALMRALPGSIVLYPSDAVSTWRLVGHMASYTAGISYLRTTRMETPVLYDNNEKFPIGGCKVLKESVEDKLCVIGAGVTLFEALKAYDALKKQGIYISVIDLYCIKPLDITTIMRVVKASGAKVITVEDHYVQGGIGDAVAAALCNEHIILHKLAVTELPRSGKPEELLAYAGIDAAAIIMHAQRLMAQ